MASQGVVANSRLAKMQMRFQQKQQLEREQRKSEMTAGIGAKIPFDANVTVVLDNATNLSTSLKNLNSTVGNGKVRQMFDERRRGTGIDRSYPLKPIANMSKSISSSSCTGHSMTSSTIRNGGPAATVRRHQTIAAAVQQTTSRRTTVKSNNNEPRIRIGNDATDSSRVNGNLIITQKKDKQGCEEDHLDNETFPDYHLDTNELSLSVDKLSAMSLNDTLPMANINGGGDKNNNNTPGFRAKSTSSIKLNPVLMKKTPPTTISAQMPPPTVPKSNARRLHVAKTSGTSHPVKTLASTVKTPPKGSPTKLVTSSSRAIKPAFKPPPRMVTPPPGMVACKICSRHFNEDRVAKHEHVCQAMATKKRKIFDASKHRVKGTEAEKYLKKTRIGAKPAAAERAPVTAVSPAASKKSNWRSKHEEFIAAIRAAKQVQIHLAKGGKLSDLPPPPPSQNPDYVQCPHCHRRFNEGAAARHIPKCANMLHNKPKNVAATKKR